MEVLFDLAPRFITSTSAARMFGVSRCWLRRRYLAGELRGYPISDGPAAVALFTPADVADLITRRAK
jgi:hypothetical protein